eukprot:TRINITY_DN10463_c0_g1_i1.p1 TRINITY_DN10463_c0_g1~~TRINITY_DN10463_c0_g1_i1.p1  ORF type:complete len:453 (-),score=42.34 TRINITY_DN10463_c0_g1_i1:41-1399(-)
MRTYINREMTVLQGILHPKIVQFMGVCETDKDMMLVTEFVEGGNLNTLLRAHQQTSKPLSWHRRIGIAAQIAEAIAYLHNERNVIHRDIKPDNVLITPDGVVKLCDFGLSRPVSEKVMTSVGTDPWSAPEVLMDLHYSKSADIFSFGIVLWELLSLTAPAKRCVKDGYRFRSDTQQYLVPYGAPDDFFQLVCDCCNQYPDQRPDIKEIQQRLGKIQADTKLESRTKGSSTSPVPSPLRCRRSGPQTPTRSDRLRKLLVLHVKDSNESPVDFFGLADPVRATLSPRSSSKPAAHVVNNNNNNNLSPVSQPRPSAAFRSGASPRTTRRRHLSELPKGFSPDCLPMLSTWPPASSDRTAAIQDSPSQRRRSAMVTMTLVPPSDEPQLPGFMMRAKMAAARAQMPFELRRHKGKTIAICSSTLKTCNGNGAETTVAAKPTSTKAHKNKPRSTTGHK